MLIGAADHLVTGEITNPCQKNALLESFTVHLRAIIEFLYPSRPEPDNVIAGDFIASNLSWPTIRPSPTVQLSIRTVCTKRT